MAATRVSELCRQVWKPAREKAGVESLPPYDLRHAFASLQIRAGMSTPELAEQLGHSPQMTVMTYTHVSTSSRESPESPPRSRLSGLAAPLVDPGGP